VEQLEERILLATFTVTNVLDNGKPHSLRWAINKVNKDNGHGVDTINFNIAGTGPFIIAPTSPLPAITHPVLIDGYSQPGSQQSTQTNSDNAVILIELSGVNAGFSGGLTISAGGSTVRGLAINQFAKDGIRLTVSGGDVIAGDFLGTDATGIVALPNQDAGVLIDGSNGNTIGGTTPAARNLVSGNTNQNIFLINGSSGNVIAGNFVGLTATGKATLPTDGSGVSLFQAPGNTVGGIAAGAGNVIGGQTFDGVAIDSSNGNVVQGNFIGTDPSGTVPLGNAVGVFVGFSNAAGNTIGGAFPGAGNLISGNFGDGVLVNPAIGGGNAILGNRIGTDASGTISLANGGDGVHILGNGITVGGTTRGARNLISGNLNDGVFLDGASSCLIEGNFIGTDASGTEPIGNGVDGVAATFSFFTFTSALNNTIGGISARAGNIIAFNGHNGVTVGTFTFDSSTGNAILSNRIFANGALGIDLGDDGVTPNSPGGHTFGANDFQNFPVLLAFVDFGTSSAIKGTLNAAPSTLYTIQFFGNHAADPSGFGQGQFLLGTMQVTTDATGNAAFQFNTSAPPAVLKFASATATDSSGNTSEFAQDIPELTAKPPVVALDDAYVTDINTTLNVSAPGVQTNDVSAGGVPFTSVVVTGPTHGSVTLNPDGSFAYTPDAQFLGTDSFTYQDIVSGQASNVATVTIEVRPKTFVVTNTNDSGDGSLRQAILFANQSNSPPPDTIQFDIPGTGPFVITPLTGLPAITHPTIIDGYTQPGASVNTATQGDNATILIQLDGSQAGFTGANGLTIEAGGSTVKGLSITNFSFNAGIDLTGAGGDTISGDFLGTDPTGAASFVGNFIGVTVENAGNNLIGGTSPDARDLLSGNSSGYGIEMFNGTSGNQVQGDLIGTDASGLHALGNFYGILLFDAPSTSIGGTTTGAGNVISGNVVYGVFALQNFSNGQGPDNSVIEGNLIGTDATGAAALGNGSSGLELEAGANLVIGGTAAGAGNVISGNLFDGIGVFTPGVLIEGNFIGTDAKGTIPVPNSASGIEVFTTGVTIGGIAAGAGNVISGNAQSGILLEFSDNLVQGNFIGTDRTGANPLGNTGDGVTVSSFQAANNTIGGPVASDGNVIAFNGGAGVSVLDPFSSGLNLGNAILSNSIFSNQHLGIDLGGDGVTPNHAGGLIPGPNGFENFPVLTSAVNSSSATTIQGSLSAAASETFTIQFFANATADPSGFGQGQIYLGSITVTTDSNGNASFTAVVSVVPVGYAISATATDPGGNTSEFSQDITVASAAAAVRAPARANLASVDAALAQLTERRSQGVPDHAISSLDSPVAPASGALGLFRAPRLGRRPAPRLGPGLALVGGRPISSRHQSVRFPAPAEDPLVDPR
jgi:hypothetical protein